MNMRFGAAVAAFVAFGASAVDASTFMYVDKIASSTQGPGNSADVYAGGYGADTPSGANWSEDPTVFVPPGSDSGIYQSPFNNTLLAETRDYFSVGAVDGDGDGAASPVSLIFNAGISAFNILWGSIDSYNTINFFAGATLLDSFTGTDIVNAFGLGGSGPNYEKVALLHFYTDDRAASVTRIEFVSTQAAFEFALAPATVPVPAGGLLLLGAIGGVAALRRRKSRNA